MVNKKIWVASVALALAIVTSSLSCTAATNTSQPNPAASGPAIDIAYSGAFAGQTASGLLTLVVRLTIENTGYESFNTSPDSFSVRVDDYSYGFSDSDLKTTELQDGETVSGELTFQVPPEAATTRTGYNLQHSGQPLHNIRWSKQVGSPSSATSSIPAVSIVYSDSYMWVKESGSLYLLIYVTIENRGYESFNTSPERFSLVMGQILGEPARRAPIQFDGALSDKKDGAYSDLRSYDLQNGGKLTGTLAFLVPPEILSSTERYTLNYSGVRSYNILWSWKPPAQ